MIEKIHDIRSDLNSCSLPDEAERKLFKWTEVYLPGPRPDKRVYTNVAQLPRSRTHEARWVEPRSVDVPAPGIGIAASYQARPAIVGRANISDVHSVQNRSKEEARAPGQRAAQAPIPDDAVDKFVAAVRESLTP